ncbi:HEAT repeat domain-containing protein [Chthoniobacter flavus]|nr:hypothetical protein [Chthoniobacter flavus]
MKRSGNRRAWRNIALAIVSLGFLITGAFLGTNARAVDVSAAVSWYDTLGFPDVKDAPYVRVATDRWIKRGNQPPENRFVEGFLTGEDVDGFTVFLCSTGDFNRRPDPFEPYPPPRLIHFVRKTDGPVHLRVNYEVIDFPKVVGDLMAVVHDLKTGPKDFEAREKAFKGKYPDLWPSFDFHGGWPVPYRVRLFSFGRACQQKGLNEVAGELFDVVAKIPDEQTGEVDASSLRDKLQREMGETVLTETEEKFGNPSIPLTDLLKIYESFPVTYPANKRLAYAQESADLLRKMIAEEAAHHPKPRNEMSPAEQVAEDIYQLRNETHIMWIRDPHYPAMSDDWRKKDEKTPIQRLVDSGNAAVPQLIEALGDPRFTRSMEPRFNSLGGPHTIRVGEVARHILEFLSGRNLYPLKSKDGQLVNGTTRHQAEAWWREVNGTGEKQTLIKTASAGRGKGLEAARRLVEKYPDDALPAIEAALKATPEPGYRGEYVEVAGLLPADTPVAFLRAQLTPDHDVYSQVSAAKALFKRGQPEAVPAIIDAWRRIQPRLPSNDDTTLSQAGYIISFLARSGDARAIDALADEAKKAPLPVRYAAVEVFRNGTFNGGGSGPQVSLYDHVEKLPAGEAEAAVERLLATALEDKERFFGPAGNLEKVSFADPRICDMAAYVMSHRWPEKYAFQWSASGAECDTQIVKLQDIWRSAHGMPPLPTPAPPPVIPAAPESEVAPLLDAYVAAKADADREPAATKIVESMGLRALPQVRARLEHGADAATLRPLALRLASIVREVHPTTDPGGMAEKSGVELLRGKVLSGKDLDRLAHRLEDEMPVDVAAVTLVAERGADGAGFQVTIGWQPGNVPLHAGWSRDMAVRLGDKTVYRGGGWTADGAMDPKQIFRQLAEEFDKATRSGFDAPVLVRLRLQRETAPVTPVEE